MTRDRLQELRRIAGMAGTPDDNIYSIEIRPETSHVDSILNEYADVRRGLETISANLDTMKKISSQQTVNFSNKDLDNLRTQNLSIGQKLMIKFKDFKTNLPAEDDFTLEARMKRTLFHGMYQEYINLWSRHEQFLQNYEAKLKKNLQIHARYLNAEKTEEEAEELLANKQTSLFVDNILEETERERQTLRSLLQRQTELEKLERSIIEVHDLFLRIQNLVMEQNDRIQIVEYHAQQATINVEKGGDQLDKAHKLKIKNLKCKTCFIIWGIVIFIIFIVLAFIL